MPIDIRPKQTGLAAKLAAARVSSGVELKAPEAKPITYLKVADPAIKDRLGIVFDDSGSMCGTAIKEAKDGVVEFLRSCVPNQTAVAIYTMNAKRYQLDTNLPYLADKVLEFEATGSTPLVATTMSLVTNNKELTRGTIFSDGQPDRSDTKLLIATCKERKLPLDTVFIGSEFDTQAISFMQRLAEATGGTFIHLKPGVSMRNTFKYLAPAYRGLLTDKSFRDKVESGQV